MTAGGAPPVQAPPRGRTVARIALFAWAPAVAVVVSLLMVNHTVAMPGPDDEDLLASSLARLSVPSGTSVVHVISAGCSCTESLVRHLLERGADPARHETILYVGEHPDRDEAARAAGYGFEFVRVDELGATFGLRAAPVLAVLRDGELAYAGGYYRTPAAVRPQDQPLLEAVERGEVAAGLPVFGCAVDPQLRAQLDPLGLQGR